MPKAPVMERVAALQSRDKVPLMVSSRRQDDASATGGHPEPASTRGKLGRAKPRPVLRPSGWIEPEHTAGDPAVGSRLAHDTAAALLARARAEAPEDPALLERLGQLHDETTLEAVAELWSSAAAQSLPGALWRVYLMRAVILHDPSSSGLAYERGAGLLGGVDPVVAGAARPAGADEVRQVADAIMTGVFTGDFADALERLAAFARVCAAGWVDLANDADFLEGTIPGAPVPPRATEYTVRAARLSDIAQDLARSARLWRIGALD